MKKICEYDTRVFTFSWRGIMWHINREKLADAFDMMINNLISEENKKIKKAVFIKKSKYGTITMESTSKWGTDLETAKTYLNNFNKKLRANMRELIKSLGYKPKAVDKIR